MTDTHPWCGDGVWTRLRIREYKVHGLEILLETRGWGKGRKQVCPGIDRRLSGRYTINFEFDKAHIGSVT